MRYRKNILSKNSKNSIAILLTDNDSINEKLILKLRNKLIRSKISKFFFIGDKVKFNKIFIICKKNNKFKFINIKQNKGLKLKYLKRITLEAISLYEKKIIKFIINLPLDKKKFFSHRFNGYTEFFSNLFGNLENSNMLLFNDNFSVSPITTHIKLKEVEKKLTRKKLLNSLMNIIKFFDQVIKKKVKIIVLGINPHASKDFNKNNFDYKVIKPIINKLKKNNTNIEGPISADTAFLKTKNKVFIGMYHDQVLTPFKIINGFDGINITIGNPVIRMSPDHGTAKDALKFNKNISAKSLAKCIDFCEKFN